MDFDIARRNMVDSQIRPNNVTDEKLIEAMGALPREAFVAPEYQGVAYVDEAIPLDNGRWMMAPMALARLLEASSPASQDLVLVVGCATGYEAAVLSHLVGTVVAVESDSGVAQQAAQTLTELGIDTVAVVEGDLEKGYPDQGPYDVIFFNGAVAEVPDDISRQLAESGRLVAVISDGGPGPGKALRVANHRGVISTQDIFDLNTPLLPGFEREKTFQF